MRSLIFLAGFLGAASLAGCHKRTTSGKDAPNEASIKRSLDELRSRLGQLESKFAALRKQVERVAPDQEGVSQVRAQFYSTEEARGITDAKVSLIASRLASASGSRRPDDLRDISKDIAETDDEVRQIDELQASLSNRLSALQRSQVRNGEIPPATGSPPSIARTR